MNPIAVGLTTICWVPMLSLATVFLPPGPVIGAALAIGLICCAACRLAGRAR